MKKIGEGKTAIVYSDGQYAYKHFRSTKANPFIDYEVGIQNEIYDHTKLPVLKYKRIENTIQMTLVQGVDFSHRILEEKYKAWLEDFVGLQVQVYDYHDLDLLDAFSVFNKQIIQSNLKQIFKDKAMASLEKIERKTILCHLDFHPLNILYDQKQYYIIDWLNAKLAHPCMDIASTYIIFKQYIPRHAKRYVKMICEKANIKMNQIIDAIPLMAFIKLRENHEEEHQSLLEKLVLDSDKSLK